MHRFADTRTPAPNMPEPSKRENERIRPLEPHGPSAVIVAPDRLVRDESEGLRPV